MDLCVWWSCHTCRRANQAVPPPPTRPGAPRGVEEILAPEIPPSKGTRKCNRSLIE
jgi:hypothetical protein